MLELDKEDHLFARQRLLRCYLDLGEAALARDLLDRYPDDPYCCFAYSRVLIECIALMLEEEDASEEKVEAAITKAYELNPLGIWVIALHETFADAVEHADRITDEMARPLSMVDAIRFFDVDVPIWKETEGAIDHVLNYIEKYELELPTEEEMSSCLITSSDSSSTAEEPATAVKSTEATATGATGATGFTVNISTNNGDKNTNSSSSQSKMNGEKQSQADIESDILMFESMYRTAIEMAST